MVDDKGKETWLDNRLSSLGEPCAQVGDEKSARVSMLPRLPFHWKDSGPKYIEQLIKMLFRLARRFPVFVCQSLPVVIVAAQNSYGFLLRILMPIYLLSWSHYLVDARILYIDIRCSIVFTFNI